MNKLIKKTLEIASKVFAIVGLVVIISSVTLTVPVIFATHQNAAPEWNTGTTASEQNWFQVSNATQGGTWANTISDVKPGDVINFKVYMHNDTCAANDAAGNNHENCPQTVATNAYVHVDLPQNGGNVVATIGSDQAVTNLTRTMSLALPQGQTISYKAGSARIVHNQFDTATFWPKPNTSVTENAADNVTSGKLDQGDISGCYSWSRFITFQAVVSNTQPTPTPTPAPTPTPTPPAVLGTTTLPNTGPETGVTLLLAGLVPAGLILRRFKL